MKISLPQLHEQAAALTQAGFLRLTGGLIPMTTSCAAIVFTRTNMASVTGHQFFEMGSGQLDPVLQTRLLMQYAKQHDLSFTEVKERYIQLIRSLGLKPDTFRKVVASCVGALERPVGTNRIPSMTPTMVFTAVKSAMPDVGDLYLRLITDFVCHMFRPLGWVVDDASYQYELKRTNLFPTYLDLVDAVEAKDLLSVLQVMQNSDLRTVKTMMDRKSAIMPHHIAQHLSNAVLTASDLAKGAYDAEAVVVSALTVMQRIWDPETPREQQPSTRLRSSAFVSDMRSNLALFNAAQDMVARRLVVPDVHFGDEEMISTVFPLFQSAINELSPFKLRMLSDVVGFLSKKSSRNQYKVPGYIMLTEAWDFTSQVTAFAPVQQTADGTQRFLVEHANISAALEAAMKPVQTVLNVANLVDGRMTSYDMTPMERRVPREGTQVQLGLPSLIEREVQAGLTIGVLGDALKTGVYPFQGADHETERSLFSEADFIALTYDYYSVLLHLAVTRGAEVTVSQTSLPDSESAHPLYLAWTLATDVRTPIAMSAVERGMVTTSEPLEALAYMDDFQATERLVAMPIPLSTMQDSVHAWDWYGASEKLSLVAGYNTTVGGKTYMSQVTEHEMLGIGVRRSNVRFLRPSAAAAIARLWLDWLAEDEAFISAEIDASQDDLVIEALRGRRVQSALQLFAMLKQIGSTGAGSRAAVYIMRRLSDAMYGEDRLDDYSELGVGIQQHKLNVWSGLTTLQLLGLITVEDSLHLMRILRDSNALAMVVGSIDMTYLQS